MILLLRSRKDFISHHLVLIRSNDVTLESATNICYIRCRRIEAFVYQLKNRKIIYVSPRTFESKNTFFLLISVKYKLTLTFDIITESRLGRTREPVLFAGLRFPSSLLRLVKPHPICLSIRTARPTGTSERMVYP